MNTSNHASFHAFITKVNNSSTFYTIAATLAAWPCILSVSLSRISNSQIVEVKLRKMTDFYLE